jgi:nitric oxide reductase subunit C
MNETSTSPQARKRSPLLLVLGGCLTLFTCLILLLAANAVYWTLRVRESGGPVQPVPVEQLQSGIEALPEGDASRGERLFSGEAGCSACHSLEPGARQAGPSLDGIGSRAGTTRQGYSAELYLYDSIVNPRAALAEGFPGGIMPENFRKRLDDQALADLIAFLMAQK